MALDLNFSEIGKKLTHYHTHTKAGENESLEGILEGITGRKDTRKIEKRLREKVYEDYQNSIALCVVLPSPGDVYSAATTLKQNPSCDMKFKIATPYGMTRLNIIHHSKRL